MKFVYDVLILSVILSIYRLYIDYINYLWVNIDLYEETLVIG